MHLFAFSFAFVQFLTSPFPVDSPPDTIQLITLDSKIRHCLFCVSYRDNESEPKLTDVTEKLQSLGVQLWDIKLGLIEKESVNQLISESLVRRSSVH